MCFIVLQVIKKEEAAAESAKDCKPTAPTKHDSDSRVQIAESQRKHAEESRARRGSGFSSKQGPRTWALNTRGLSGRSRCQADSEASTQEKDPKEAGEPAPAATVKHQHPSQNHPGGYPALATNPPCSLQRRGQERMFRRLGGL